MPRSTSSSASSSRKSSFSSRPSSHGSSASLSRPVTPNVPKAPHPTPVGSPALQPIQVDHSRTLGQSIKDGFGFGIGSAFAHRIFGGSAKVEHVHTQTTQTQTQNQNPEYAQCLKESNQNYDACKHLLDQ